MGKVTHLVLQSRGRRISDVILYRRAPYNIRNMWAQRHKTRTSRAGIPVFGFLFIIQIHIHLASTYMPDARNTEGALMLLEPRIRGDVH